jgi:hypothetical protein
MQLHINGDGDGFEFRLLLRWRSLRSLLVAVGALLAAPVITQMGGLLGWWSPGPQSARERTACSPASRPRAGYSLFIYHPPRNRPCPH